MPNDMSTIAAPTATADALLDRAARYVRRAHDVADTPGTKQAEVCAALEHLQRMQSDLAAARRHETRALNRALEEMSHPFRAAEAALKAARNDLSEALLRAEPSKGTAEAGIVPHNAPAPDGLPVRPISACRALIDLEALRPYLTDHALRVALQRYLQDTGLHDVAGVSFAALPEEAHLPCEIQ